MGSFKSLVMAGACVVALSTTAQAADLLPPPPPMEPISHAAPVEIGGGWYLRGDIGVGAIKDFEYEGVNTAPGFPTSGYIAENKSFGDQVFVGAGIGYQFNSWLRTDVTAEYRSRADFKVIEKDTNFCGPGGCGYNTIGGGMSSVVGLVNVYADLGTFYGITPFVGAGVGFAHNRVTGGHDLGFGAYAGGIGSAPDHDKTGLAWAIHAGLGYEVSQNLKLELAYRYLNLGDAETGVVSCNGGGCPAPIYKVKDIDSHDFKIGMRWMLAAPAPVAMPMGGPIIRKY